MFDNTTINYLIDKPGMSGHELDNLRNQLVDQVRDGKIAVIGSLSLLEEIMGTAAKDKTKYRQMVTLFWELVGGRVLKPWNTRMHEEVKNGYRLPETDLYLDSDTLRKIHDLMKNYNEVQAVSDEVYKTKQSYLNGTNLASSAILARLHDHTPQEIRESFQEWFQYFPQIIEKWAVDIWAIISRELGGVQSPGGMPSNWKNLLTLYAFLSYTLTKIYERFHLGYTDHPGDVYDMQHFVDATTADYLVTNDARFTETYHHVPVRFFKVIDFDQLINLVRQL